MILRAALVAEAFHACGLKPPRMMVRTRSLESAQELLATGRFLTALPGCTPTPPGKHSSQGRPPLSATTAALNGGYVELHYARSFEDAGETKVGLARLWYFRRCRNRQQPISIPRSQRYACNSRRSPATGPNLSSP